MSKYPIIENPEKDEFLSAWNAGSKQSIAERSAKLEKAFLKSKEEYLDDLTRVFRRMLRRSLRKKSKLPFHVLREQIKQAISLFESQVYFIDYREIGLKELERCEIVVFLRDYSELTVEISRPIQDLLFKYVCSENSYDFQGSMVYLGFTDCKYKYILLDEGKVVLEALVRDAKKKV